MRWDRLAIAWVAGVLLAALASECNITAAECAATCAPQFVKVSYPMKCECQATGDSAGPRVPAHHSRGSK